MPVTLLLYTMSVTGLVTTTVAALQQPSPPVVYLSFGLYRRVVDDDRVLYMGYKFSLVQLASTPIIALLSFHATKTLAYATQVRMHAYGKAGVERNRLVYHQVYKTVAISNPSRD
jgi:hypothetical protein